MNRFLIITIVAGFALSCGNSKSEHTGSDTEAAPNDFVAEIENAHKKAEFLQKPGIVFTLHLVAGDEKRLSARIWMKPDFTRIMMENDNGVTLIYDGQHVYQTPPDAEYKSARFDMFTWPYFFTLPYKLSDPGTMWELQGIQKLESKEYETGRLTFENGTGDASDDWYLVYSNPFDHKVFCAAYIVTYNKSEEKANEDPHAIIYSEYKNFDGIPIATEWTFRRWREEKGLTKQLMKGYVTDLNFVQMDPSMFDVPDNSKLVEKP